MTQKQIELYQTDIEILGQERQNLRQKINQARQKKLLREKIMTEFQQIQKSGLFSMGNPDTLESVLEELWDSSGLQKLTYQLKQVDRPSPNNVPLHWYKIIVEFEHHQDQAIFQFIETLPSKLPGLIVPEQLSLTRSDSSLSDKNLGNQVSGFYHFYVITFDSSTVWIP
ncbi:MAG: hypothetical protein ACRYGR_06520 [Janthinobacterium lividum]